MHGHPTASLLLGAGLALAAAFGVLAWQRRSAAVAAELQAERARVQRLLGLIDTLQGVVWRTDAQHNLIAVHPPAIGWRPRHGEPLWQRFAGARPAEGSDLEQHLRAHAALVAIDVSTRHDDSTSEPARAHDARGPGRWRLQALPCFDDRGRFDGHEGIAVRLPDPAADQAANPDATAATDAAAAVTLPAAPDARQAEEAASFSYSVSHDLRAPIRVVEGFAKILKEDYGPKLDRIGNDHIDRVLGAAARMHSMIDALLSLSRLSTHPLARQRVNLSQLATYVIEDLRRQAPERRVEAIIQPGLQAVGDPILLRVMLENLLGNAWKYSGQRNLATIEFGNVALGGRSAFCVSDNGAGFDMRFADRLFGVFQRLHSSSDFAGTGVGLATVRRIVHRHGGDIWAEAEVDRGAKFYFTLPG